jgi:ribose transport system ATP-binding protein
MSSHSTAPRSARPGAGSSSPGAGPLLRLREVSKRYGRTQALDGADLEVMPTEVVGLVGHNGAGKSTLMRVVAGITTPDAGSIEFGGGDVKDFTAERARQAGVRIVFQELSLCPDLRVFENLVVANPWIGMRRWRARARALIKAQLDEVFPGHGISPWARVETLTLGQRQMVEIAQATLRESDPRLVILDEPTSALDRGATASLFRFIERERERGVSFILISHRIGEVLENTDRIAVMRDGRVVAARRSADLTEDDLVGLMGGTVAPSDRGARALASAAEGAPALQVSGMSTKRLHGIDLHLGRGEVVGLAGLEGQGQQDLLYELWHRRGRRGQGGLRSAGRMAFVSGDRGAGVFPLWALSFNISIGALSRVMRRGAVSRKAEVGLTAHWLQRLAIRGRAESGILDLSGGNQQKVLIARALAAGASVILLDDPFRGVDISTRQDTYRLIREEATEQGRSFLWFSTENEELEQCDRVYVLWDGAVAAELTGEEISADRIIAASFARSGSPHPGATADASPPKTTSPEEPT